MPALPSLAGTDVPSPILSKLAARAELPSRLAVLAHPLVFTNGVFDVLHRGHVICLEQARALGASLVVALNSDASARRLGKGPGRPLNAEIDRGVVIAALQSVDLVTWFDEDTPVELLRLVRPDVYCKGGDYDMELLEEARVVKQWGGRAVALDFAEGYSTTALVDRVREPQRG
ncbi:MAG: adenylyltransferase/cytidyltransferase family protein [Ramlibacter sp.]|jgi:rfaE bifunctional protein nucleotidyltransferase chain/domain|nr:adenylyltransferase/cytidyltransferase family protein [Ramlibacter sp.]